MKGVTDVLLEQEKRLSELATEDNWPDVVHVITELQRTRRILGDNRDVGRLCIRVQQAPAITQRKVDVIDQLNNLADQFIEGTIDGVPTAEVLGEDFENPMSHDDTAYVVGYIVQSFIEFLASHKSGFIRQRL